MKDRKYGYGFYFRCIQGQIEKIFNEELKKDKLTKSQMDVLRYLEQNKDHSISQKEIEEFFHVSNPTVTGLLNRLEQKNFIKRVKSKTDKRIHYIEVTEKAEELRKKQINRIHHIEATITTGLNEEEKEQLFVLLSKVKDNLVKEEEEKNDKNTRISN